MAALDFGLGLALALLLGGGRRKRFESPGPPGVPPGAFPPAATPGTRVLDTITFPAPPKPDIPETRATPEQEAQILRETGFTKERGIPISKSGWRPYSPPPRAVVARAMQLLKDRSMPVGANVTETDPMRGDRQVQYRKRMAGGKMNVFAFVR